MSAAAAAVQASTQQARRRREEEMTAYTNEELNGGWEFKILRGRFDTPEAMEEALSDEARFGWALLEKFDERRIRLKRAVEERAMDHRRHGDPYRSTVPAHAKRDRRRLGIAVAAGFAVALVPIVLLFLEELGWFGSFPI